MDLPGCSTSPRPDAAVAATVFDRRALLRGLGGIAALALAGRPARAQEALYLRIATGSAAGTYFPVGETIARLLSHPPGLPACDPGTPCGVNGLVATAETSEGSVANVAAVADRSVETALAQSDVVAWAYGALGLFEGKPALANLRVIASLYAESMHIVVRADGGIVKLKDLIGKKVSLDRPGSGTRGDALAILEAAGIRAKQIQIQDLGPSRAAEALASGEIDAMFFFSGAPSANIGDIAGIGIALLPIEGALRDKLLAKGRYFMAGTIPEGAYPGVPATETVNVSAQWICALEAEDDLIHAITRALFDPVNRPALDAGHPRAADIRLETAVQGLAVPLHPGAVRFYREQGVALPAGAT